MNDIKAKPNGLSLAALIFGILAVLGSFTVVGTPFLSGLAIMFSWLSRGDRKMCGQALAGNILGAAAIFISLIVAVVLAVMLANSFFGGMYGFVNMLQ